MYASRIREDQRCGISLDINSSALVHILAEDLHFIFW